MPTRMIDETAKSTSETITAENGKISRGKYTFVTRLVFAVSEFTANRSDEANRFQAIRPVYEKIGYGMPVSSGATRTKMTEKMRVFSSGMNTAQPKPMIVCL